MDEQQVRELLDNEDLKDTQEFQEDQLDNFDESNWEQTSEGQVPYQKRPESLFSLFNKVWRSSENSKVANLDKYELGKLNLSVRDSQYLALLGKTLRHEQFSKFFNNVGEITLTTSASKKGWFTELFVSQKKFTTRHMGDNLNPNAPTKTKGWSLFGGQTSQDNQASGNY